MKKPFNIWLMAPLAWASILGPNNLYWRGGVAMLMFLYIGWSFVLVGRDAKNALREGERTRKKESRRQRILELEKELGIEPLNLDDLDPVFEEIEKEGKRK